MWMIVLRLSKVDYGAAESNAYVDDSIDISKANYASVEFNCTVLFIRQKWLLSFVYEETNSTFSVVETINERLSLNKLKKLIKQKKSI